LQETKAVFNLVQIVFKRVSKDEQEFQYIFDFIYRTPSLKIIKLQYHKSSFHLDINELIILLDCKRQIIYLNKGRKEIFIPI
jgi:hypothetical protein